MWSFTKQSVVTSTIVIASPFHSDRTRILVYLRLLKSHLNVGHMEKSSYIIAPSQFLEFGHRQSISSITFLPRCIRLARLHSRLRRPYHRPPAHPFKLRGLLNGLQHWMRRGDTTVQEVCRCYPALYLSLTLRWLFHPSQPQLRMFLPRLAFRHHPGLFLGASPSRNRQLMRTILSKNLWACAL